MKFHITGACSRTSGRLRRPSAADARRYVQKGHIQLKYSLAVLVLVISVTGCAIVTMYGNEPKALGDNRYKFTLYFNVAASDEDIDAKADEVVNQIKANNSHQSCKYTRGRTRTGTGNQSVVYRVECQ